MRHIEEIDRLDVKALFPKVRRHPFKKFPLRIGHDHRLGTTAAASLRAAHKERNDKAPGLIRARSADADDIVVFARLHPMGNVGGVFVRIIGVRLDASEDHAGDFPDAAKLQVLTELLFRREAGGAVRTLRENVKAARIAGKMIAGEPPVALLCDQADQKDNHSRCSKTEGRKDDKKVFEGIQHPDALHLLARQMEYRFLSKLQRVEQHPIKIPPKDSEYRKERHAGFVPLIPAVPFIRDAVLQLFQKL